MNSCLDSVDSEAVSLLVRIILSPFLADNSDVQGIHLITLGNYPLAELAEDGFMFDEQDHGLHPTSLVGLGRIRRPVKFMLI